MNLRALEDFCPFFLESHTSNNQLNLKSKFFTKKLYEFFSLKPPQSKHVVFFEEVPNGRPIQYPLSSELLFKN